MGIATDGILCLGMVLDENQELPWAELEAEHDELAPHVWYYKTFVTPELEYQQIRQLPAFTLRLSFNKPEIPFELVNYCSLGSPMWILAEPSTIQRCGRGKPIKAHFCLPSAQKLANFVDVCRHIITGGAETVGEVKIGWWLASFWEKE